MKKVLVLCTGNSCRSIMAEALINHLAGKKYKAVSAGSHHAGYVHPKSIAILKLHGVPMHEARSKSWDEFKGEPFNIIITVCNAAAEETCPAFAGECQRKHWDTPDPAKAEGTEQEINQAFDKAFKMLKKRIEAELL